VSPCVAIGVVSSARVRAYLGTLCFEIGVCDYFSIPAAFISISQASILFIATPLIISTEHFCALFSAIYYLYYKLDNTIEGYTSRSPTYEIYVKIISVIAASTASFTLLIFSIEGFLTTLTKSHLGFVLVTMIVRIFVSPLFTHHGEGNYWHKLSADTSGNRRDRTPLSSVFTPCLMDIIAIVSLFDCCRRHGV
jgi:hypothetical protein